MRHVLVPLLRRDEWKDLIRAAGSGKEEQPFAPMGKMVRSHADLKRRALVDYARNARSYTAFFYATGVN